MLPVEVVGNGVVAVPAPRVAAQDAADAQIEPFQRAVFTDGLDGILRAGGRVAARRGRQRRYVPLIQTNGEDQKGT